MPMIRILHVTECASGGVPAAIETISGLVPEFEHHLLWTGGEPSTSSHFAMVHRLPNGHTAAFATMARMSRKLQPTIIHAHSSWAGVYTRIVPTRTPIVYQPHCYKFDDPSLSSTSRLLFRQAERFLAPRSVVSVVLSQHEESLADALTSAHRTKRLSNVASHVPTLEFPPSGFEPGNRVVMIGRIGRQKDPEFFIETMRLVHRVRSNVQFVWIGDGEPSTRMRLASEGAEVTGWLSGGALLEELSRPSVYFHTAKYEGFPISILDAAAFEHPVVARDIPPIRESGLEMVRTPLEACSILLEILDGGPAAQRSIEAVRHLNRTMTVDRQRVELIELYERVSISAGGTW